MGKLKSRNRAAPAPAPLFQTHNPNNQTKNTHTQLPQNPQNSQKKKGGSQEAVSKLIQALGSSSLPSQTQEPYPEAESTIIITHHHHHLLGCHKTPKTQKDQIKIQMFLMGIAKQKCWNLINLIIGRNTSIIIIIITTP
jgi:hypothetical protein